jgi:iron complex outermembrane receptor protein
MEWQKFSLAFACENLFNEKYYTGTAEAFGVSGIRVRPNPRLYSVSLRYQFGG